MGVTAIFGPSDPVLGANIYSICDALDIPYLDAIDEFHTTHSQQTVRVSNANTANPNQSKNKLNEKVSLAGENSFDDVFDFEANVAKTMSGGNNGGGTSDAMHTVKKRFGREFTIHLNPSQILINNAFQDVMRFLNWTKVAIIYEKSHGSYQSN